MPSVQAQLDFLPRLAVYEKEKPYHIFPSAEQKIHEELECALTNVRWEPTNVTILDTRDHPPSCLDNSGFQIVKWDFSTTIDTNGWDARLSYLSEVSALLSKTLKPTPVLVVPFECKVRFSHCYRVPTLLPR